MLQILSILRTSRLQNVRNIFLTNLAIGDLLNLCFCIPVSVTTLYVPWPFGQFVCKYILPLSDVIIGNCIFNLLAITFERYQAIISIQRVMRNRNRRAVLVSLVIWVISYLIVGAPLSQALHVSQVM